MDYQRALHNEIDNVRVAYEQAHGCLVEAHSLPYIDSWLRHPEPDLRLPLPRVRAYYREPGLWLPLECAITFVRSAKKIGATTDAADFSGCNSTGLIVAFVGAFTGSTFSDTSSNSWTQKTTRTDSGSGGALFSFYCRHPTATSSHQFSWDGTFYSIVVLGFASVDDFDTGKESGANGDSNQPGSLTPTNDGSLFVAGYGGGSIVTASVNSPFSGTEVSNDYAAGVNYSSAGAYFIQTTAASQNPTWSDSSGTGATEMLVFKPEAGMSIAIPVGSLALTGNAPTTFIMTPAAILFRNRDYA